MGESVLSPAAWTDPTGLFGDATLARGAAGALEMAGVPLDAVAREAGTPAYVYSAPAIRNRYRSLTEAFEGMPHRICYAIKANANLAVLRVLRDLGAGADIVSLGELRRALAAGLDPRRIVFSGVGKREDELEAAVAAQLGSINLESTAELAVLERVVARRKIHGRTRVGIRVNPDVTADTHPYITTGKSGIKFGIPIDEVVSLARAIQANPKLELVALAMHLGSQLLDAGPYIEGFARLVALLDEIRAAGIDTVTQVDIGGGLGIRYHDEETMPPRVLADRLRPLVLEAGVELHLEPGRYLIGSAGILLTQVLYRKRSGGKEFVVVDAGMNDLVRPSRYNAHHGIVPVSEPRGAGQVVDVVGPVCETGDFLALDRALPDAAAGDYLAVLGAGAYGFVMSSTYNGRPLPVEVLIDRGRWAVVRPRETLDDLYRGERVDPFAP